MPASLLDIHTLLTVLMLVLIVLGVMLLLIWRTHKTYPGFGLWTAGGCLFSFGLLMLVLRGSIPDFFSIIGANVFLLTAAALYLGGVRSFRGIPQRPTLDVALVVVPTLASVYYTYVDNNISMRIVFYSLFSALFSGRASWELIRKPPPFLRFQLLFTGSVFAAHSLLMLFRTGITIFARPYRDFFAPDLMQGATFLLLVLFGVLSTFGFLMLNNERLEQDLKEAQEELRRLATTDYLTGIANSRTFAEKGAQEIQRARRYSRPLAALLLDLDHFKRLNDTRGHAAGDKALVAVASVFRTLLRDIDVYARLGGEEFAILLPETDQEGARTTAERLRTAIAEIDIDASDTPLYVTVSIGIAHLSESDSGLETVMKRADGAMYEAKRQGRNRVITAAMPSVNRG